MNIIVAATPEIASRQAVAVITKTIKRKPHAAFLLPTGDTPLLMYRLLTEKVKTGHLTFAHTYAFTLDEYVGLSARHPQSYRRYIEDNFLSHIDIKKGNMTFHDSRSSDLDMSCEEYERRIRKVKIDVAVLGIGRNGHIGFNEPGTDFSSQTHVTDLARQTITDNARFFSSRSEVPTQAMTVGLNTIMSAKHIILLAFGTNKAEAIRRAIEGPQSSKVPASILQKHPNVTVLLDAPAAELLSKTSVHPPVLGDIKLFSEFNLPRGKKIVFFSPHPDDAPICAGAILAALSCHNDIHEIVVTTGHHAVTNGMNVEKKITIREKESQDEAAVLGTKPIFARCRFYDNGKELPESDLKKFRAYMQRIRPDMAFVPQKRDSHPTHAMSRKIALATLPSDVSLWSFETPWGLFTHHGFNAAFEFGDALMKRKLKAIRKHKSQISRTSFDDAAESIGRFRSITIAEQFFSELGKESITTQPYLELFTITNW